MLSCAHGQSLRESYVRTPYSGPLQEDLSCTALPDVTHLTRYWQSKQRHRFRDLGTGCLLWNPSLRGGRRKRRKIAVVWDGATRLTTQPLNDLLQLPSSARRSVSNLTAVVPSGDSHADHAFTATAHNSQMTMAYSNAQSVHQVAGQIHDFIVDYKPYVLILTETWLQEVGDEHCVKEKTPQGYVFNSFPHVGQRGGGITVLMSKSLAPKVTFWCLS